ncbi:MAG: fibrillarin-like rRNA/tRNA 2'-O-methyltransferase [Candidatus Kariarchaeaceae archaeon]|jgi:fibrillarin-like pre-rRNA processing protein
MNSMTPVKLMEGVFTPTEQPRIQFVTVNLTPGFSVYGEQLLISEDTEYREWVHSKSKLASAMVRGLRIPELKAGAHVLYLGAASGTTISHISDIVGETGIIFAVEFSTRPMRDLVSLAKQRANIIPILADARRPIEYAHLVHGVDVLYADVAQPNQSELFLANAKMYLKSNGMGFIAIKTRSISQKDTSKKIFQGQIKQLENGGFITIKTVDISKFHREHRAYLGRWK